MDTCILADSIFGHLFVPDLVHTDLHEFHRCPLADEGWNKYDPTHLPYKSPAPSCDHHHTRIRPIWFGKSQIDDMYLKKAPSFEKSQSDISYSQWESGGQ